MRTIVLFTCLLASSAFAQNPPAAPSVIKSENGRYVFGQVGPARADQYLLDTQTGRLWQIVVDKEGHNKLQPVPIIQFFFGDEAYVPETDKEAQNHRQLVRQSTLEQLKKNVPSAEEKK